MDDHDRESEQLDKLSHSSTGEERSAFAPASLRLSQSYNWQGTSRLNHRPIRVRKPDKQEYFRVHPSSDYWLETKILELKAEKLFYLVDPKLWGELSAELSNKALCLCINRRGELFLWPLRLPDDRGRFDDWGRTALDGAQRGREVWIRVTSNMGLAIYEIREASGDMPGPKWPDNSLEEILKIAFADRYVTSLDHPVLCQLRGEW